MGGHQVGRREDRLHGGNPVEPGSDRRRRTPGSARLTTSEGERLKELKKENQERRRANEIQRLASEYVAKA